MSRSSAGADNTTGIRLQEVLKPLTYFPERNSDHPQENLGNTVLNPDLRACAFLDMHRKLTLNFRKSHGEFQRRGLARVILAYT
jgi:hypothetical protein